MRRLALLAALALAAASAGCTLLVESELASHAPRPDGGSDAGMAAASGAGDAGGAGDEDAGLCPFDVKDYAAIDTDALPDGSYAVTAGLVAFHGGVPGLAAQSVFAYEDPDAGALYLGFADDSRDPYAAPRMNQATPLVSLAMTARHLSLVNAMNVCAEVLYRDQNGTWLLTTTSIYCTTDDGGTLPAPALGSEASATVGWADAGPTGAVAIFASGAAHVSPEYAAPDAGVLAGPAVVPAFASPPSVDSVRLDSGLKWIVAGRSSAGYGSQLYNFDFTPYLPAPLSSPRELRPVPYEAGKFALGTFDDAQRLVVTLWGANLGAAHATPAATVLVPLDEAADADSLNAALVRDAPGAMVRFAWTARGRPRYADVNTGLMTSAGVRALCVAEPAVFVAPLDHVHLLVKGRSGELVVRRVPAP